MRPADTCEKVELLGNQVRYEAERQRVSLRLLLQALLCLLCLEWPCLRVLNLQITVEDETGTRDDDQKDDQEDVLGEFPDQSVRAEGLLPYVDIVVRLALFTVYLLRTQDLRSDAVGVHWALVAVTWVDALGSHSNVL